MGHPKDIFKNRGPLTEEEIKAYLSGSLNDKQRREIELKMAQDEFNMSAMEGFQENTEGIKGFEEAQQQVYANISKAGKRWQFHHTIILSLVLMIGTMLLGPFLFPDHGQTSTDEENPIEETLEEESNITEETSTVQELSDEEIEAAVVLDELNIVHAKEVISESPVIIDSTFKEDPVKEEIAINESIEIKKVAANTAINNIEIPTKDEIVYSNVPLIYMKNFLLVDYSKIYVDPPTFEKIELTGTNPALENKDDELSDIYDNNIQTEIITYQDYLRETQEMFEKHEFKSALKRYKVILAKYPEDLNAHFYSGLCYFNIGKYDLAIQHFKMAKNHPYNTFQIDAEWYLAKTYYQQGKLQSCANLLNKIVADGQFYKPQAEKLLNKIQ